MDVRNNLEFDSLSNDINATVDTLKRYIKDAEERIDAELAFAKAIQHSALPSVFPPYPNRTEFEVFATMHTAKEVGGDFYDFYFVDEDNLAFLIADVSGKGKILREGGCTMKELTIAATVENIESVTDFVNEQLEALDCPMKAQMQIEIAIDEIFSNIAHYAYNPEIGQATVRVEVPEDPLSVMITFIDNGVPYDPLAKADPDTTLSAEERDIGGLGIYMVKKSMDEIVYEYKNGHNILKIKKNLHGKPRD